MAKKSITDAINSPLRSSTPDGASKEKARPTSERESAKSASEEETGERRETVNITSGWGTNLEEDQVFELDEEEKEVLKQSGNRDVLDQFENIRKKTEQTKKALEEEERRIREEREEEERQGKDKRTEESMQRQEDLMRGILGKMDQLQKRDKILSQKVEELSKIKRENVANSSEATKHNTAINKGSGKPSVLKKVVATAEAQKSTKHSRTARKPSETEEEVSESEEEGWQKFKSRHKAKKLRKSTAALTSDEMSETEPSPQKQRIKGKPKSAKEVHMETLARSRLIESRPKTEEEKFGDDGKINYFLFKKKFHTLTDVEGMNPIDVLSEVTFWLKAGPLKLAQAYQSAEDPEEALEELWSDFDEFYNRKAMTALERISPVIEKPQIRKNDVELHLELLAELKAIKREAEQARNARALDREDIVRDIVTKRIPYMADDFYKIQATQRRDNKAFRLKFDDLIREVKERTQTLKAQGKVSKSNYVPRLAPTKTQDTDKTEQPQSKTQDSIENKCHLCQSAHPMDKCNRLMRMKLEARIEYLKKEGICFRCFQKGHIVRECPAKIFPKCTECPYRHHTVLHGAALLNQNKKRDEEHKKALLPTPTTQATGGTRDSSERREISEELRTVNI